MSGSSISDLVVSLGRVKAKGVAIFYVLSDGVFSLSRDISPDSQADINRHEKAPPHGRPGFQVQLCY